MQTVLVALLEEDLSGALAEVLRHHGFESVVAATPEQAVRMAEQMRLGLMITDENLPPVAGKDVRGWIRSQPHHTHLPALVLTSVPQSAALPWRDDTHLLKPIDLAQVVAHAERLLGKPELRDQNATVLDMGALSVDLQTFYVKGPGGAVALTSTEFRLLRFLLRHRGEPVHPALLLKEHWGAYGVGGLALVRVHIRNLRNKLRAAAGGTLELIRTIPGRGYLLAPPT